jgi:hypothetical protein
MRFPSYYKPRKCYKICYRKRVYYLGPRPVEKSDEAARTIAFAEWEAKKRFLDDCGPPPVYDENKVFDKAAYDRLWLPILRSRRSAP